MMMMYCTVRVFFFDVVRPPRFETKRMFLKQLAPRTTKAENKQKQKMDPNFGQEKRGTRLTQMPLDSTVTKRMLQKASKTIGF